MTILEGFIAIGGSSMVTHLGPKLFEKVFPNQRSKAALILAHSEIEGDLRTALHEEIQRLRERCDLLEKENIECRRRNDSFEAKIIRLESDLAQHIRLTKVDK